MVRLLPVVALALGAAGCGGSGGPGGAVVPPTPTFQDVQASIFTPHCALSGCHVSPGAPFNLDLSAGAAYGNVLNVSSAELPAFDRIEPSLAQDSYLYMKVSGDPRILGDPMPALGPPLSAQKLQLLADWIAQGATP